jgi:hypothetical protein
MLSGTCVELRVPGRQQQQQQQQQARGAVHGRIRKISAFAATLAIIL